MTASAGARRAASHVLALVIGVCACARPAARGEISVAAATSLREVMPELARAYEMGHPGAHVSATYGASGDLERQVEAGAPVDAVFFAAGGPVDRLVAARKVRRESRRVVATNALVLVGAKGGSSRSFATLAALPAGEKVAIGDPRTVPAGQYARDYLTALGEWDALQDRLVYGGNVAAVLVYARRGEAAVAVVYRTEMRGVTDLAVLDEASGPSAPHAEVVAGAAGDGEGADFVAFVASAAGAKVLAAFGFGVP